jgi:hypothetical protein
MNLDTVSCQMFFKGLYHEICLLFFYLKTPFGPLFLAIQPFKIILRVRGVF